jgi:hypothetical protein
MLLKNINLSLPRKSLIYLLLSIFVLCIILFAVIIPYMNSLNRLDEKIQNARFELEEQRTMTTLYQPMSSHEGKPNQRLLPLPQKNKLSRKDQDQLISILKATAGKCHLDIVSVSPDLSTVTDNAGFIIVNTVFKGDFFMLRRFLIGIGEIYYLEKIEEIHVQQQPDKMEFSLKLRFAVT